MKTLQQIKDEYLEKEYGTVDFSSFDHEDVDEIAKRYARECCKASLEKASEEASLWSNGEIDTASICTPKNIVLL